MKVFYFQRITKNQWDNAIKNSKKRCKKPDNLAVFIAHRQTMLLMVLEGSALA